MFIEDRPVLDSGALALEGRSQPRHHNVGQLPRFQKLQQRLVKEPAVRPHRAAETSLLGFLHHHALAQFPRPATLISESPDEESSQRIKAILEG